MDPHKMNLVLRPRTGWESIDLGFAMARHWFLPLWLLWWMTALPLYAGVILLFADYSWLVLLLIWWCKPLYEPPLLFWLSRAVFDEMPPLGAVMRQWFSIVRPQLLANLTWRRFSAGRSFYMPVGLLERLRGRPRKRRIRILGWRRQTATWLTVVGIHFEIVLEISCLLLLVVLIPDGLGWVDMESLFVAPGVWEQRLGQILDLLAMSLIAPFYVAGGFALYLMRRTELEAWDIELGFHRLAARDRPAGKHFSSLAAGLAMVLTLVSFQHPARAAGIERMEVREVIREVLADEDFGRMERIAYWRYTGRKDDGSGWWKVFAEWIAGYTKGIAVVGEVLMWLAVGLLTAFLAYRILTNRGWLERSARAAEKPRSDTPAMLFGLDVTARSLPRDIAGEALRLLQQGVPRAALSLLYRGGLGRLVQGGRVEIPASATEGECLRRMEQHGPAAEAELFRRLTDVWLLLAYAHRRPPDEEVESLCREWQRVYPLQDER